MRLFVGIEIPFELRELLSDISCGLHGARWVPADNLHLNLRFLGETSNHLAEEVDHALAALRGRRFAFSLAATGLNERSGRVTSLWAGVAREPGLDHLQTKIETALRRAGIAPDKRRFQPRVDLARVDNVTPDRLAAWMQAHNLLRTEAVEIAHFTLFSSQLGCDRAVYTPEVEYGLS